MTWSCRPTGPSRTPTTTCASSRRPSRRWCAPAGVDPADVIGVGIDFTACTMLPALADGTPLCQLPGLPLEPARLGQALEAPRRPARGGPDQRGRPGDRPGLAGPLRREDLVRVVLLEGAPDPRRGARGLRRGRPPDRGGRLGRLAADRRRDPQRLHGRLQGDVVEARRLPGPGLLRRARPALRRRSSTRRCDATSAGRRARRRPVRPRPPRWTGLPARDRGGGRATSTPTSPSRPRRSPSPGGWS